VGVATVTAQLTVGEEFGGCRVTDEIGRGGMAVVYRAVQLGVDREVAVKVMAPRYAADPRSRERFMREWRQMAAIDHPNVIPIHTGGEQDGRLFIVMKLVHGTDLYELLVRAGRYHPAEAVGVLEQLASALDAAHAQGVIHRDVTPANVLVADGTGPEDGGHVYLTDFGIALELGDEGVTEPAGPLGAARYLAPERLRGGALGDSGTVRGDVYSLGLILTEMLGGLERPATLPDDVPQSLADVAARATSLTPAERFATAGALARAARAALMAAPVPRPSTTPTITDARRGAVVAPLNVGLCDQVAELCSQIEQRIAASPGAAQAVARIRADLRAPLRIAVAGRVSAGKSTLVNALLGRRIAETDIDETTAFVTWYEFGAPDRVRIVMRDGTEVTRQLAGDGVAATLADIDNRDIAAVHVVLQLESLRDRVILDTVGLGSLTEGASERTLEYIEGDALQSAAIKRAHALVFVMAGDARQDDEAVLERFRNRFGSDASATNAIGVLSKIDSIGADDRIWDRARAKATRMRAELGTLVSDVVPMIGLLAETADTGVIGEQTARHLQQLARAAPDEQALTDYREFAELEADVAPEVRRQLRERLQEYGLAEVYKLHLAEQLTSTELVRRLREVSGITELNAHLEGLSIRAPALKAEAALARLTDLSWKHPELSFVRGQISRLRQRPEMQDLELFQALDRCSTEQIALPAELGDELVRLATAPTVAGRLGVAPGADTGDMRDIARRRLASWMTYRNAPGTSLAAGGVALTVIRAYEHLLSDPPQDELRGVA